MLAYQIPKANTSFFLLGDQGNLLKYDYKNILQILKLIGYKSMPTSWMNMLNKDQVMLNITLVNSLTKADNYSQPMVENLD